MILSVSHLLDAQQQSPPRFSRKSQIIVLNGSAHEAGDDEGFEGIKEQRVKRAKGFECPT